MNYIDERFADIQILRYCLNDFDSLSLQQKRYIYCLSEATLWGRDITFDQFGKHNLRVRKTLEAIYLHANCNRSSADYKAFDTYLKQVWFASGVHHHYSCDKFTPAFTEQFFQDAFASLDESQLPLHDDESKEALYNEIRRIIFDPDYMPKRVNLRNGDDLVLTSACNYYEGVTQSEAEAYYKDKPLSGLNNTLRKTADGTLVEDRWCLQGKYSASIRHIIYWLKQAITFAENDAQRHIIHLLIDYYETGHLHIFDEYSIEWIKEQEGRIDFINGFIEVYGDPLGIKGSWEGIVEYKDLQATKRTQLICQNAQWFEDHSPVNPAFRKPVVRGVSATVVCAAQLGGDEYPASAIGINLPNADWIHSTYGSKSVTIGNLTEAYDKAAKGNGFLHEFVNDADTEAMIEKYGDICDNLHTDLHECLGHGSGQILPGVDPGALRSYGSTIEEARADLFGLYYIADQKLIDLGLLPNSEAYKSQYYTYMLNGLLTQCVRIHLGNDIEESHMRNRALIARWVYERAEGAITLTQRDGKTYMQIHDYARLRQLFALLLAEIQRIKSEGDYEAARSLVEQYAIHLNLDLHREILSRYQELNIAPYKGFVNPVLREVKNADGEVINISVDYTETYTQQMLRYGRDYSAES